MSKFWKTKTFSRLNTEWQERLAASGFVDIEKEIGDEKVLKQSATNSYRTRNRTLIESKVEFYRLVGNAIHKEKYITLRDHAIMTMYSNGVKQKDMLKLLEERGIECKSRVTLTRVITRYLCRWNIPLLKPRKTK